MFLLKLLLCEFSGKFNSMQNQPKKILFTGGGTAGHVAPNLALIQKLKNENCEINYMGSKNSIEQELLAKENIPFYTIATGKLRRYFSFKNFIDPFKIFFGIVQAFFVIYKLKPDVVFSKGGFVAFPVVFAAWLKRVPIIAHESDLTVGLANKLCFPFVNKICVAFPDSAKQIKRQDKVVITGIPIREEFFHGDAVKGREICGFSADKKVILVFGGSLGSEVINKIVRKLLPEILEHWQIAHVCGANKVDASYNFSGYKQFSYLHEEFSHVLAAADLVIARAGAGTIYELIALRKLNILIPLGSDSSRGDQILNAAYCAKLGISEVILQKDLVKDLLNSKIRSVMENREQIMVLLQKFVIPNSVDLICSLLKDFPNN